jgi:DNA-binding NarL/FixJ family response regulator
MPGWEGSNVPTHRVVLADDHPFYRLGLARLLTASGVQVVAEAANGWAALKAVEAASPDVVVLDLDLPGLSGAEVTRRLTSCDPPHRVLVVSVSDSEADVIAALHAGARGYVLKDGPVEDVVAGIAAVSEGESLFSPRVGAMHLRRMRRLEEEEEVTRDVHVRLSKHERDVLRLVVEGRSNQRIGEGLSLDARTARKHVSHLLEKLGVDNRVQAAVRAAREGLV